MALDNDIQSLLRSNFVKQINFTMAGIRVSGHGFRAVSDRLSNTFTRARIRVTVNPRLVGHRNDAEYDPGSNKINLRSDRVLQYFTGRAIVVHECTHAQCDLRALRTSVFSEEGAAYIAETWYLQACGVIPVSQTFTPTGIWGITSNLRARAAQAIGAPVALTSSEINAVRTAVRRHTQLPPGHYHGNGVRGFIYRGP